jgi:hypothetical protein
VHVAMVNRHLELNDESQHVKLYCAAAGTSDGTAYLSDEGMSSTILSNNGANRLPVPIKDFFNIVGAAPIDLLKMDIEGGEYQILTDPRFASLSIGVIALEWHNTPAYPDGAGSCRGLLTSLGYDVVDGAYSGDENGMLWAYSGTAALPTATQEGTACHTF